MNEQNTYTYYMHLKDAEKVFKERHDKGCKLLSRAYAVAEKQYANSRQKAEDDYREFVRLPLEAYEKAQALVDELINTPYKS